MSMRMEIAQSVQMTLEMRQALLQKALEECTRTIEDLRAAVGLDERQVARLVFAGATQVLQEHGLSPEQKSKMTEELQDAHLQAFLIDNCKGVINGAPDRFRGLAAEYLVYCLETNADGNILMPGSSDSVGASRGRVIAAIAAPADARTSIQNKTALAAELNKSGTDPSGLIREISEESKALQIAESLNPHVENYATFLTYALALIKDRYNQPILSHFFREIDLQRKLNWQVSERIVCRFAKGLSHLRSNQAARDYEDMMINTIGEFVLVSLGVVGPELFTLKSGEVREREVLAFDQSVDDGTNGRVSVVDRMKKCGLIQSGFFFWNRWAIPGVHLTANTDEAVRNFIRGVIVGDKKATLEALGFESFIQELKNAKEGTSREDRVAAYGEILRQRLSREVFREYLKRQCSNRWYPALKDFFVAQGR